MSQNGNLIPDTLRTLLEAVRASRCRQQQLSSERDEGDGSMPSEESQFLSDAPLPPAEGSHSTHTLLVDDVIDKMRTLASPVCDSATIAWTLRLAGAMGAANTDNGDDPLITILKALYSVNDPSCVAAGEGIATTALRQFDASTASAVASLYPVEIMQPLKDSIGRRTRRLAAMSRTCVSYFTPHMIAPVASYNVGELAMRLLTTQPSYDAAQFVYDTTIQCRLHPLRVLEALIGVWSDAHLAAFRGHNAVVAGASESVRDVVFLLAGTSDAAARTLMTQALTHLCNTLTDEVALVAKPTSGGGGGGRAHSRDHAVAAATALHRGVVTLASLVRASSLSLSVAWGVFCTAFPHTDVSSSWFSSVSKYTAEHHEYVRGAQTEVLLDAAQAAIAVENAHAQVIGENFALLSFTVPKPAWGLLFASSSTTVAKMNPVHFASALLIVGALKEAQQFVDALRFGPVQCDEAANGLLPTPYQPVDLLLCPNAATMWGSIGTVAVEVFSRRLAVQHPNAEEALRDWATLRPPLVSFFDAWAPSCCLTYSLVKFLSSHYKPDDGEWLSVICDAAVDLIFPSLLVQSPSPCVNNAVASLLSKIPIDALRKVVLLSERVFNRERVGREGSLLSLDQTRHRTLLHHVLNRVNSADPRRFSGHLAPVTYANAFIVSSRLLTKAVGYSDPRLHLTNALLVRDSPPLFFLVFPIMALERAMHFATKEDSTAVSRVTAIATLLSLVWRHNSTAVNSDVILMYIVSALLERTRYGFIFSSILLKCVFDHVLHQKLEHTEHRSLAQMRALGAGPLGVWFAGGAAVTFKSRWVLGVFNPKLLRRHERLISDALKGKKMHIALLYELLRVHSEVFERYRDLPGTLDDVMLAAFSDMDVAGDLAACVFQNTVAQLSLHRRPREMRLVELCRVAVPSLAIIFSSERQAWRDALFATPASSSTESTPLIAIEDSVGSLLSESMGVPHDVFLPLRRFFFLFWCLDLADLQEPENINGIYQEADAALKDLLKHASDALRTKLLAERRKIADLPSRVKREIDDESATLDVEREYILTRSRVAHAALRDALSSNDLASHVTNMNPSAFVRAALLSRARVSTSHALYCVVYISVIVQNRSDLRLWVIEVLRSFISSIIGLFVSLSEAESSRLGVALQQSLTLLRSLCENEAAAQRATVPQLPPWVTLPLEKVPIMCEAYLTQSFSEVLLSPDVPPFVVRNALQVLDRIKGIFPSMRSSSYVVGVALRSHCVSSSPHFASAMSLSHHLMALATAQEKVIREEHLKASPYQGSEATAFFDRVVLFDAYLASLLDAPMMRARELEAAFALRDSTAHAATNQTEDQADDPSPSNIESTDAVPLGETQPAVDAPVSLEMQPVVDVVLVGDANTNVAPAPPDDASISDAEEQPAAVPTLSLLPNQKRSRNGSAASSRGGCERTSSDACSRSSHSPGRNLSDHCNDDEVAAVGGGEADQEPLAVVEKPPAKQHRAEESPSSS